MGYGNNGKGGVKNLILENIMLFENLQNTGNDR